MKQVLDETLNRIAETEDYHEYAPEFGERAWRVKGGFADNYILGYGQLLV